MSDNKYKNLKIENIVASGVIADSIDLEDIAEKIENCELNKKKFPGAVFRIENPKVAVLVFSSGKIVMTGIRREEDLKLGLDYLMKELKAAGVSTFDVPDVAITNMVCSYDTEKQINLNRIVVALNLENIEYEPEQFPGLVYRLDDPKIVALLFSSGKVILTGGRNLDDVRAGLDKLEKQLESIL
ncbi:TATA-box binding family protein [Methanolacinia petrolearia DSM 11571]|uniref:TATA-box-binding protein n=1 Tax=Methanolacinia petrolearia (strain DSM 11571 / OCM 486 / SEBR 4847) TaxID=679926 RepID=E1RKJ2_METP4|nr:TATA-box-binding protein [Methanolacinia petrolearia]ADN35845.1 TATA-box binding family protein [Methanolacinia petrolearia DSM 11571]